MNSIRDSLKKKCDKLINLNDKNYKLEGLYISKALEQIKCIKCLDTKLLWKDREGLPFSAWDARGSYDYINCNVCGNGFWNHCSHINTESVGNIKIFHYNDENIDSRFSILKNYAIDNVVLQQTVHETINSMPLKKKIETLDNKAKWELCKSHTVSSKEKSIDMSVNAGELVKIVTGIVEASFGNVFCLIGLAKELDISLSHKVKKKNEEDRIIKNKDNKYLFIKVVLNVDETKSYNIIKYSKSKIVHDIHVSLLIPKNKKAQDICDNLLDDKAKNIVKDILDNF